MYSLAQLCHCNTLLETATLGACASEGYSSWSVCLSRLMERGHPFTVPTCYIL